MKNLKFYINDESKLNEYEKENKKISYATLIKYLFSDMILCNEFYKADENFQDYVESGNFYDEETGEYTEIYQYYIVNFAYSGSLDFIQKYLNDEIILFYSEKLDLYILGVDHFGTGWSYVLTDLEYTTNYEESMQSHLYDED